jgi:hypothetical protein
MGSFSKFVHHYHNRIMFLSSPRQLNIEINGYNFPFPLNNWVKDVENQLGVCAQP